MDVVDIMEARDKRQALEKEIQKLIIAFEKDTNLKVFDVAYKEIDKADSRGKIIVKTIKVKVEI